MSSIRQPASSSTLSTNSTSSISSSTSSFDAPNLASDPTPQYPSPARHSSSTKSADKDATISTTLRSSSSPFPTHHHKDAHPNSHPSANEPLVHSVKAKTEAKSTKKGSRGCMGQFDFTYSGLYVSGSKYGRRTLGTGTGAGGSGECVMM